MNIKKSRSHCDKTASSAVFQIKIDDIRPNRSQPRIEFDTNSIIRLADSIRRYGILHPLSVRKTNEEGYRFELIAGERRLRAARSLGYFSVPCIIVEADEKMSAELAIIENLLREDLNMFEEAYGFRQLIDNYSMTQEEIARKVMLSQSAVANKLRLLKLSYDEQQKIIEYELTERHARALLRLNDAKTRLEALEYIGKYKLNVLATEQYVERLRNVDLCPERLADEKNCREYSVEKAANDVLNVINKKLDSIKKSGNDANVSVKETQNGIELLITISKTNKNGEQMQLFA